MPHTTHFLELLDILFIEMVRTAFCRELFEPVRPRGLIRKLGDNLESFTKIGVRPNSRLTNLQLI